MGICTNIFKNTHTHTCHKSSPRNGLQKQTHIFMGYMQRMLVNLGLENPERIVLDTEMLNYYSYTNRALSLTSYKNNIPKKCVRIEKD